MKVHPVIFLVQNFCEIGKPKAPKHEQEKNDKVDITLEIEGLFKLHIICNILFKLQLNNN